MPKGKKDPKKFAIRLIAKTYIILEKKATSKQIANFINQNHLYNKKTSITSNMVTYTLNSTFKDRNRVFTKDKKGYWSLKE